MDERKDLMRELECIICHECLFKPISLTCGHTFCRICLLKSCEAQGTEDVCTCPICRDPLCACIEKLSINMALWNVIRVLYPDGKVEAEEEAQYQEAKITFEAQQEIRYYINASDAGGSDGGEDAQAPPRAQARDEHHHLHHRGGNIRIDIRVDEGGQIHVQQHQERTAADDDNQSSAGSSIQVLPSGDEGDDDEENESPWLVRVDELQAEELFIRRNIVLDQDAENVDGRLTMRLAFGIVEFPSVLESYVDGQSCQVALLQMEEDEERDAGYFPVFMSDAGDDDVYVLPCYDDARLTVVPLEDHRQAVLVRNTSARGGMIEFPNLRLDVPAGLYIFRIDIEARGLFLEVTAEIHDPTQAPPRRPRPSTAERTYSPIMDRGQRSTLQRRGRVDDGYHSMDDEYDADDVEFIAPEGDVAYEGESDSDNEHIEDGSRHKDAYEFDDDDEEETKEDDDDDDDDDVVVVARIPPSSRLKRQVASSDEDEDDNMPLSHKRVHVDLSMDSSVQSIDPGDLSAVSGEDVASATDEENADGSVQVDWQ
ncbi:Aste57867_19085 [Aphanomyces stellatus]|uniref:RING-type E3 ubiquitin transferase n=1 Tax=Aphanomyces stellatus TaxID=120398 RepID=A0A485LCK1_9STRA|nr:hypothetical protein As57867_019021 [Aphanomyces stellatus]VFT95810.1 Aste57867_19085 [Aphanomyces stellatus]